MAWTELEQFITDSPGAVWDETHAQEIIDNVSAVGLSGELVSDDFGGTSGTAVTFADKGGTDYAVVVTALGSTPGTVGEISYTRDSATQATIYNSGSYRGAFVALVMASTA
jgi:hypothetical protein